MLESLCAFFGLRSLPVPAGYGLIRDDVCVRPLPDAEYRYWQTHDLPARWVILSAPACSAADSARPRT